MLSVRLGECGSACSTGPLRNAGDGKAACDACKVKVIVVVVVVVVGQACQHSGPALHKTKQKHAPRARCHCCPSLRPA